MNHTRTHSCRSMRDKLNDSDDAGVDHAEVYIVVRPKAVRGDQVPQINDNIMYITRHFSFVYVVEPMNDSLVTCSQCTHDPTDRGVGHTVAIRYRVPSYVLAVNAKPYTRKPDPKMKDPLVTCFRHMCSSYVQKVHMACMASLHTIMLMPTLHLASVFLSCTPSECYYAHTNVAPCFCHFTSLFSCEFSTMLLTLCHGRPICICSTNVCVCVCVYIYMHLCAYTYLAPLTKHHTHAHEHMSRYAYIRAHIRCS